MLVILTPAQTPMEGSRSVNPPVHADGLERAQAVFRQWPSVERHPLFQTQQVAPPFRHRHHEVLGRTGRSFEVVRPVLVCGAGLAAFRAAAARSPAAAIGAGTRCRCTASNSLAIAPLRFSPAAFGQPVGEIDAANWSKLTPSAAARDPPVRALGNALHELAVVESPPLTHRP